MIGTLGAKTALSDSLGGQDRPGNYRQRILGVRSLKVRADQVLDQMHTPGTLLTQATSGSASHAERNGSKHAMNIKQSAGKIPNSHDFTGCSNVDDPYRIYP